ncbi:MAG: hypothetical protein ACFFFG_01935 [Candidatus Thorarchaeota archaeon]
MRDIKPRRLAKRMVIISSGIIFLALILVGTLDIFFGSGVLGLLLYGFALAGSIGGYSYRSIIFTGSGIASGHKIENIPENRGKLPLTLTLNVDTKKIMYGYETDNTKSGYRSREDNRAEL